jgi:hypothetical protein
MLPTHAQALWNSLLGHSIVAVRRQFLRADYEALAVEVRDEESDGPIELRFDSGMLLHLQADTEQMSVRVAQGAMPPCGEHHTTPMSIAGNEFWRLRIAQPLMAVDVLASAHAAPGGRSEFAVELVLANRTRAVIEYLSDEEHVDQIRIAAASPPGTYQRINIARLP